MVLNWLLSNKQILARRDDLKKKRLGAVNGNLPVIIWIHLLTRPHTRNEKLKKIWKLKTKFNNSMQRIVRSERYMHIIQVDDMEEYQFFTAFGDLTDEGQIQFWKGVNKAIKHIDEASKSEQSKTDQTERRLPTPPPRGSTGKFVHA